MYHNNLISPIAKKKFHYALTDENGQRYDLTLSMDKALATTALDKPQRISGIIVSATLQDRYGEKVDPTQLFTPENEYLFKEATRGNQVSGSVSGAYTKLGAQVGNTINHFIQSLENGPAISWARVQQYNFLYSEHTQELQASFEPIAVEQFNGALEQAITQLEKPTAQLELNGPPVGSLSYIDASAYRKKSIIQSLESNCPNMKPNAIENLATIISAASNIDVSQRNGSKSMGNQTSNDLYSLASSAIEFAAPDATPQQIQAVLRNLKKVVHPSTILQR